MPRLPKWSDAQSVTAYLVAVLGALVSLLGVFGVHAPHVDPSVMAAVGLIVATVAQGVNSITHRHAHAKAAQVKPWQAVE